MKIIKGGRYLQTATFMLFLKGNTFGLIRCVERNLFHPKQKLRVHQIYHWAHETIRAGKDPVAQLELNNFSLN